MPFQLPSDELVTVPFCKLGTPVVDFVLPPIIGSDSSLVQTQQFGIPPVQAQDPLFGGLPVLRKETNGVLQFYSNVLYFMNQGGQFTFDAAQSTALGGYSEGAVLFDFATSSYVISLIDNNTFDFVTTPSYIDGTHWQSLNKLNFPDITDTGGLVSIIGAGGLLVSGATALNGALDVAGAATFVSPVVAQNNATIAGYLLAGQIAGRGGIIINTGGPNTSYLGSNSTGAGGLNGFKFNDDVIRPIINNISLVGANSDWVACINDINVSLPILQDFSVVDSGGNTWSLTCVSLTGVFPATRGVDINGTCLVYNYGTGGTNSVINLAAAGIVTGGPTTTSLGVISIKQTAKIGTGNLLELFIEPLIPTGLSISVTAVGPSTGTLNFQIKYK